MNKEYKERIEKLKQELLIMKTLNIKPNIININGNSYRLKDKLKSEITEE